MAAREHEAGFPMPGGGSRCIHCGAPMGTPYTYTCLKQSNAAPPRARPASVVDDRDAISRRLDELRVARKAALNTPGET